MSIGALKRQTKNFLFNIINFNFARWHGYEHENWDLLDAILSVYVTSGGLKGIWKNSTTYAVNDRVIDTDLSELYLNLVPHTSGAEPQTFAQYRAANPTHWRSITYDPQHAGTWTTATAYGVSDFVIDGARYGVVQDDYVSGATYDDDVTAGHIVTLIDLSDLPADIIDSAQLKDNAVSQNKIAASAVVASKIQDTIVSNTKLSLMGADTIKANVTGAPAVPQDVAKATFAGYIGAIPSGTRMLFQQTAAPTGWTKDTTHNDKALRIVSGAVGTGGTNTFSATFANINTAGTSLTQAQLPTVVANTNSAGAATGSNFTALTAGAGAAAVQNASGGSAHNHAVDLRVQYVDFIIATKD